MKKAILIGSLILLFVNAGFSQFVNGVNIKNFGAQYLQVNEQLVANGTKVILFINYGQTLDPLESVDRMLRDSAGMRLMFNSIIDGLNYMHKNGYELVQPYGEGRPYFLMRRMKKD